MRESYCKWCGLRYESKRTTSRYCSDTCRVAAHRHKPETVIEDETHNINKAIDKLFLMLERSPRSVVEVDEELMKITRRITDWQRANYSKVLSEENRRQRQAEDNAPDGHVAVWSERENKYIYQKVF